MNIKKLLKKHYKKLEMYDDYESLFDNKFNRKKLSFINKIMIK